MSGAVKDPCIAKHGCRSPVACGGFGYCRERNVADVRTTPETIERHRREAERRAGVEIISERRTKIGQVEVIFSVGRIRPRPSPDEGGRG